MTDEQPQTPAATDEAAAPQEPEAPPAPLLELRDGLTRVVAIELGDEDEVADGMAHAGDGMPRDGGAARAADFPDPAVIRTPDGYYAYATQTQRGGAWMNIQVARSNDLVHWQHHGKSFGSTGPSRRSTR